MRFGGGCLGVVANFVVGKETLGFVANLLRHLLVCRFRLGALANTARILAPTFFFFQQFFERALVAWA